jgi:hypothetical protein
MTGATVLAEKRGGSRAYRWGVAVAAVTAFLTVWTTIVRDDGAGIGWFLIIMAAEVGAFAAWFRADGMARTILGVAIMQALFATAIATAPVTATLPDRGLRALVASGVFTLLWLASAAFFRAANEAKPGIANPRTLGQARAREGSQ